jgi:hypothetical protein
MVVSAEQDPVTEEGEADTAIHLPLDHLRLSIHASGPAVMKRQGDRGDDGLGVQVQAAGEGVQARQVLGAGSLGPVLEPGLVSGVWAKQGDEGADQGGEAGHLGAGVSSPSNDCWLSLTTTDNPVAATLAPFQRIDEVRPGRPACSSRWWTGESGSWPTPTGSPCRG